MNYSSKQNTDVDLVKSASPVRIGLKLGACFPHKRQFPLHPDTEQGIQPTIEGLIQARVLVETSGYCNTPILPVAKSEKSKWHLVHDLQCPLVQ